MAATIRPHVIGRDHERLAGVNEVLQALVQIAHGPRVDQHVIGAAVHPPPDRRRRCLGQNGDDGGERIDVAQARSDLAEIGGNIAVWQVQGGDDDIWLYLLCLLLKAAGRLRPHGLAKAHVVQVGSKGLKARFAGVRNDRRDVVEEVRMSHRASPSWAPSGLGWGSSAPDSLPTAMRPQSCV